MKILKITTRLFVQIFFIVPWICNDQWLCFKSFYFQFCWCSSVILTVVFFSNALNMHNLLGVYKQTIDPSDGLPSGIVINGNPTWKSRAKNSDSSRPNIRSLGTGETQFYWPNIRSPGSQRVKKESITFTLKVFKWNLQLQLVLKKMSALTTCIINI